MLQLNRNLYVQGSTIRSFLGLVNFVPAIAYLFCLNLPASFKQRRNGLIVEPSSSVHVVFRSLKILWGQEGNQIKICDNNVSIE